MLTDFFSVLFPLVSFTIVFVGLPASLAAYRYEYIGTVMLFDDCVVDVIVDYCGKEIEVSYRAKRISHLLVHW